MKTMISVDEALEIVRRYAKPLPTEACALSDALGRVLAKDVHAAENIPPFDNSAMDGFAVRAADVQKASGSNPVDLKVIDVVPAGKVSQKTVGKGEAIQIMTGAAFPKGADAVVMVEKTKTTGSEAVSVLAPVSAAENVRSAGEDIRLGDRVLQKGRLLKPADVGLLASIGVPEPAVARRPSVAVLSTGDELLEPHQPLEPGKIRTSNNQTLDGLIRQWGGRSLNLGIARDAKDELRRKMEEGAEADILLTSGGVSMGAFDYVRDVIEEMGYEILFWKVRQKPGKPLVFAVNKGRLFFGLPGNPVSSMVTCEVYVRTALACLTGQSEPVRFQVTALLQEDLKKKPGLRHFMRGILEFSNDHYEVGTTGSQSSGVLSSMSHGNCLIDLPEEMENPGVGTRVSVLLM